MKFINLTFILVFILISTSFVNDKRDIFYIQIVHSWENDNMNQRQIWIIRLKEIIYTRDCKSDTFEIEKLKNSKEIFDLLDSLHYIKNYACKEASGIHSNAKYSLFSTWKHNGEKGYFSFSIINCQLNKNLDSLVNLLNTYIPIGLDANIPNIQEGFGACKCKAYNEVKVFEE